MFVHVILGGVDGDLALFAQAGLGFVQGVTGTVKTAANVIAQRFGLFTSQAGGMLQELLGVADQSLEFIQQGVLGA